MSHSTYFLCGFGHTICHIFLLTFVRNGLHEIEDKKENNCREEIKAIKAQEINQTTYARRCVNQCAASSDEQCPMRIILILSSNKQWYIHSSSSLEHHNHPPLEEEATLLLQKDFSDKDKQFIRSRTQDDIYGA